jgi:hypothetical protein
MKPKHISLLYILLVSFAISAWMVISDPLTEKIKASLKNYQVYYSPEKVYLHHDKPYYLAGDTFWFKAYVLDAAKLEASSKSGVLYVDLISEDQQLVDRLTLPISDGEAFGDFYLPDDLKEGKYTLVSYTNWMRNFGEEIFFQKDFYVLGKQYKKPVSAKKSDQRPVDLQFFPEGGDIVAGIPNEVAFKALNSDGLGESVEGEVYDDQGLKVAEFKDHFAGMGSFVFTPQQATRYVAKLKKENGETHDYHLPEINEKGWVLHIDEVNDPDNILITVRSNFQESKTAMLFGIARENLIHAEKIELDASGTKTLSTSKKNFPNGVTRFTLSDQNGQALAERLVFVNHPKTFQLSLQTEQKGYQPREEVKLSIGYQGEEELSHLSVSVTADQLAFTPDHQENIRTYLLLSADIKGHIESPGYYFVSEDKPRQEALRHLMMTQGWRRFGWESILSGDFPLMKYPNELDLNIRGRLVRANGSPVEKGEAMLFLKDKYTTFMLTETNSEGDFSFRGFYFKGNIPVVIQGADSRGRRDNVEVKIIENDYIPKIAENRILFNGKIWENLAEGFSPNTLQAVESIETEIWGLELGEVLLQEVVVEGRADVYEPFKLHTRADAVIYRDQLPVAPSGNVLEVLQGRVAGLQVTQTGMNEFRAVIRGMGTPLYLLDGIPIDESSLISINQFDINRIEILRGPGTTGIYGGRGSGGVIAFFSEMGAMDEEIDPEGGKHILVHQALGFNRTRQFYSPKYETAEYYDLPDLRSTVYWNPTVLVGPNSKREISFFTGDVTGRHRVQVEGVTKDGQPISEVFYFEVKGD